MILQHELEITSIVVRFVVEELQNIIPLIAISHIAFIHSMELEKYFKIQ